MNDVKKLEQSEEEISREWKVSEHQINAPITNSIICLKNSEIYSIK